MNDPITTLLSAAVAFHEMVRSYEHAGFTRKEAIDITTAQTTAHGRAQMEIAAEDRRRAEDRKRAQD